jgi:predicted NACHT family NTPase
VQVVEDRSAFERWLAEERERMRAAGQEVERLAYAPRRASLEAEENKREVRRMERPAPPPPIPWDERAGERFKRAVILGDPGFGKTWLLRYEARRLALKAHAALDGQTVSPDNLMIPIFVRLSELNQSDDAIEEALVRLAAARLQQSPRFKEPGKRLGGGRSLQAFHHFMREKLDKEQCVVLLDGWDEIPLEQPKEGHIVYEPHRRQRLGQRLEAFARYYPNLHILLTSRIVGYGASPIPQAQELELLAFDEVQVESFASVWFGSDTDTASQFLPLLRQNPQVQGLGRILLMLALMCRAYQERRLAFPTRRVDLYDRCLRGLLHDWRKEEKGEEEISASSVDAVLELLQKAAYSLFLEGKEQFRELDLRRKAPGRLARAASWA